MDVLLLSPEEQAIIQQIRLIPYGSIEILMQSGKPERMKVHETIVFK